MGSVGRGVKVWILITLCFLLFWIIYWVPSSIDRFFGFEGVPWVTVLENVGGMFMLMEMSGAMGILLRFIGVLFGIGISLLLIWKVKIEFFVIRKWVASALALESCYFFLLLPSGLVLMGIGIDNRFTPLRNIMLGIDYLLMVLFTAPFLAVLAIKVYKFKGGPDGFKEWKWVGVTFVGYMAALWANSVIKWFDMVIAEGFNFFFVGVRALGAINAFVLMSLALVFSIVGAISLAKKDFGTACRWVGLALASVGLHFLVFVVYSYIVDIMSFLMLAEIWTIPLLGLGLTMLRTKIDKMN